MVDSDDFHKHCKEKAAAGAVSIAAGSKTRCPRVRLFYESLMLAKCVFRMSPERLSCRLIRCQVGRIYQSRRVIKNYASFWGSWGGGKIRLG